MDNQSQLTKIRTFFQSDLWPSLPQARPKYANPQPPVPMKLSCWTRLFYRYCFSRPKQPRPQAQMPIHPITSLQLQFAPENTVYRVGHSSLLMKLKSGFWMTDPVFSERVSPVRWFGPKRFHPAPVALNALPMLKGVLISHNHYDHLDKPTIKALKNRCECFYVPLGVGRLLQRWGIPKGQIKEFNWWQSMNINDTLLVATPARHFSGRGIGDRDSSLWCSWVVKSSEFSLFFSGDSGYTQDFRLIGETYGPFDVTCIETGAYDDSWSDVHMYPEQSVKAHQDLKGRYMLPIHNGTFDLAFHDWDEPFDRVAMAAKKAGVQVLLPQIGEPVHLAMLREQHPWWQFIGTETAETQSMAELLGESTWL